MKKFIRAALLLALVALVSSGAAFADDIKVIFDPPPDLPPPAGIINYITQNGVTYNVNWESCGATGVPPSFSMDDACLVFLNQTGAALSAINLSFTVNQYLANQNQTLGCESLDDTLPSNSCGSVSGVLTLGELVNVSFFGGTPIMNNGAFYIGETGVPLIDAPTIGIEVSEPTSLTLLASGMGLLGLCVLLTKR